MTDLEKLKAKIDEADLNIKQGDIAENKNNANWCPGSCMAKGACNGTKGWCNICGTCTKCPNDCAVCTGCVSTCTKTCVNDCVNGCTTCTSCVVFAGS